MITIPKHDIIAEQAVLWSCLIDKWNIPYIVSDMHEDYFYINENKIIFKAIKSLASTWWNVDIVTLKNALEWQDITVKLWNWKEVVDKFKKDNLLEQVWWLNYLIELTEIVPTSSNLRDYCKIIKEDYILREYWKLSYYIQTWIENNLDTPSISLLIEKQIKIINSMWMDDSTQDMYSIMMDHYNSLCESLEWNDTDIKRIKTWFTELDKFIWSLHWWDLIIVWASSSIWKTMFQLNILNNVTLRKQRWLLFTMEMSKAKISDILLTMNSDIKYQTLQTWNDDILEMRNKLLLAQDRLSAWIDSDDSHIKSIERNIEILVSRKQKILLDNWEVIDNVASRKLFIDDRGGVTTNIIRNKMMELSITEPLDIVVVDQLSLMSGPWQAIRERYDIITGELKQLAREYNVPIVLVVQLLWKELWKRPWHVPRNDDVKESYKIVEDADKVLLLNRPSFWAKEEWKELDEFSDMSMDVYITKNRWWSTWMISLSCDITHQRLYNLTSLDKSKKEF